MPEHINVKQRKDILISKEYQRKVTLANSISYSLSPATTFPLLFFFLAGLLLSQLNEIVIVSVVALLFYCIIPVAYLLFMLQKGKIESIEIPNQANRIKPMAMSLICLSFPLFWFYYFYGDYSIIWQSSLIILGYSIVFILITLFTKVSVHSSSFTIFYALATYAWITEKGWSSSVILGISVGFFILIAIFWSRLILKAHNANQLILGIFVSMIIFISMIGVKHFWVWMNL